MSYQVYKDKLLRYGGWVSDDYIITHINNNMDAESQTIYKQFLNDEDIKLQFGDRLNNIRKKIIWNNNIKMSTTELPDLVSGIKPSTMPQNYKDGPQPGVEYVSQESPLNKQGMSNVSGSKSRIFPPGIWGDYLSPIGYGVAIGVITLVVFQFYTDHKKKLHKKK